MSEETGKTAEAPENTDAQASNKGEVDWEAEAKKWRALSRKNESRAAANAEKAARFDEMEENAKSELQKAVKARAAAEERAKAAEAAEMRARIAHEKGIDPGLLYGTSEDEVTEYADRLLAWREASTPKMAGLVAPHNPEAIPTGRVSFSDLIRIATR